MLSGAFAFGAPATRVNWLPIELAPSQQWSLERVRETLVFNTHLLNRIFDLMSASGQKRK